MNCPVRCRGGTCCYRWHPRLMWSKVVSHVRREDDTFWEKQRKELGLPFVLLMLTLCILRLIANVFPGFGQGFDSVGVFFQCVYIFLFAAVAGGALYTRRLPESACDALGALLCITLGMHDIANCGRLDSYLWLILVTDVLVLSGSQLRCRWTVGVYTVLFIGLVTSEDAGRWGLWNAVQNTVPRTNGYDPLNAQGWTWGVNTFIVRSGVYLVNYAMVYYVAWQVLAAVRIAEAAADALVQGDLDGAERALCSAHHDLQTGGTLESDELRRLFGELLWNLQWYRSHLPDAVFTVGRRGGQAAAARDGLVSCRIAVVQVQLVRTASKPSRSTAGGPPTPSNYDLGARQNSGGSAAAWEETEHVGREFIEVVFRVAKRLPSATICAFDARSAMVTFGASAAVSAGAAGCSPSRHSGWVEEASLCALELCEELESRGDQWERKWGVRQAARIALVDAEALAGMLGSAGRRAFHVMGRAVDLARLAVSADHTPGVLCNAWAKPALAARCTLQRIALSGDSTGAVLLGWDGAEEDQDDQDDDVFFQVTTEEDEEHKLLRREHAALSDLPEDREIKLSRMNPRAEWVRVGGGSCGDVYRAEIGAGRTECAVKELRSEDSESGIFGGALRRRVAFLRELHHLNLFRIRNIVNFYGWARGPGGELYMVMEYCARGSLQSLVYRDGLSPEERGGIALSMAISVAQALAAIHDADKVHMDVATRNVLVNERMEYKLADVGLLCDAGGPTPVISAPWAPPEALRVPPSERRATPSYDVWSFGMLVYEVLAGGPPYAALRGSRLAGADSPQQQQMPPAGSKAWRDAAISRLQRGETPVVPPAALQCPLAEVVAQCWEVSVARRPAMPAVIDALRRLGVEHSPLGHSTGGSASHHSVPSFGFCHTPTPDSVRAPWPETGSSPLVNLATPSQPGESFSRGARVRRHHPASTPTSVTSPKAQRQPLCPPRRRGAHPADREREEELSLAAEAEDVARRDSCGSTGDQHAVAYHTGHLYGPAEV
eukprot:TRINITY_DN6383_c0_g1_i3.p1 TRINITY_DN6383_c0_g1~~TRINITY_DN6383_c0_g1_i3.p1  ORF type:complete len:1007 (+),score=133.70 TRINITY_DN6383_c0_g1_i3:72-3092(+)